MSLPSDRVADCSEGVGENRSAAGVLGGKEVEGSESGGGSSTVVMIVSAAGASLTEDSLGLLSRLVLLPGSFVGLAGFLTLSLTPWSLETFLGDRLTLSVVGVSTSE